LTLTPKKKTEPVKAAARWNPLAQAVPGSVQNAISGRREVFSLSTLAFRVPSRVMAVPLR